MQQFKISVLLPPHSSSKTDPFFRSDEPNESAILGVLSICNIIQIQHPRQETVK
jgi:hypothetical protein